MKERPILFSGEMIRALLAGTKTQTRRVVKLPNGGYIPPSERKDPNGWRQLLRECKYGQPGDRLWVREAFQIMHRGDDWDIPIYRADDIAGHINGGWRPSIHMPRAACRLVLEITDVRVERLQDISEADALAEGVKRSQRAVSSSAAVPCFWDYQRNQPDYRDARSSFSSLWESINGAGNWDANPWCWVIEFKKVEA